MYFLKFRICCLILILKYISWIKLDKCENREILFLRDYVNYVIKKVIIKIKNSEVINIYD